jgi:hypothetical protein
LICLSFVKPFVTFTIFLSTFAVQCLCLSALPLESVEEVYAHGMKLFEDEEYDGALFELNKAMGMLKYKYSHPLRTEVEKQIRILKGKIVVSRYSRKNKTEEIKQDNGLKPMKNEGRDFLVQQVFGKVIARKIWENRDNLTANSFLGIGRTVTVLPNAGIELEEANSKLFSLRCVQAGSFTLSSPSSFELHSGSYAISSQTAALPLKIQSTFADLTISSGQPFACMAGVTTNGGMKIICLLGKIELSLAGKSETLVPGELVFALPDGFSRKMNVELSTLMVTANLLNDFPKPAVFHSKLNQQATLQALRTKKKFRTVVGDVKGRENFELKILQEDSP